MLYMEKHALLLRAGVIGEADLPYKEQATRIDLAQQQAELPSPEMIFRAEAEAAKRGR